MKKTALMKVLKSRGGWAFATVYALLIAAMFAYGQTGQAIVWSVVYVVGGLVVAYFTYRINLSGLRYRAERDEEHLARIAEREAWQARLDEEAERRDQEDQILTEDHERRMLEIGVTGRDPGPSGQAARILAVRKAELLGRTARDRMERKARMAARQAAAEQKVTA